MKAMILTDPDKRVLEVPHLGVTLRTMIGAALSAWPDPNPNERRSFRVQYKGTTIATLKVKQHADI